MPGGKTFFWRGEYGWDLNSRETLDTQLNVFEAFEPKLSEVSRSMRRPLPGEHPARSSSARCSSSAKRRGFVALDSMNLWIDIARDDLVDVIGGVDA